MIRPKDLSASFHEATHFVRNLLQTIPEILSTHSITDCPKVPGLEVTSDLQVFEDYVSAARIEGSAWPDLINAGIIETKNLADDKIMWRCSLPEASDFAVFMKKELRNQILGHCEGITEKYRTLIYTGLDFSITAVGYNKLLELVIGKQICSKLADSMTRSLLQAECIPCGWKTGIYTKGKLVGFLIDNKARRALFAK